MSNLLVQDNFSETKSNNFNNNSVEKKSVEKALP